MVITDEQRKELQAFCDERHLDCKVVVKTFRGGDQQVMLYPGGRENARVRAIGASYLEAKRWLGERYGDLTGA